MKASEVKAVVSPEEDSDWGFARTRRVLLRRPKCEFGASIYSARVGEFIAPNRDYPYEGLSAYLQGENWKFLDAILFAVKEKGEFLRLQPEEVAIWPWKAEYRYSCENRSQENRGLGIAVNYYLLKKSAAPTLCMEFRVAGNLDGAFVARPLIDIRHMYEPSKPEQHAVKAVENGLRVTRFDRSIWIFSPHSSKVSAMHELYSWMYKLGDGLRVERECGVEFKDETRGVLLAGELELKPKRSKCEVFATCAAGSAAGNPGAEGWFACGLQAPDEAAELAKTQFFLKEISKPLKEAGEAWGADKALALAARTLVLLEKFGLECEFRGRRFTSPDAGCFWFRNLWLRDAFETLLQNFNLLFRFKRKETRELICTALEAQRSGLIPLKLPEHLDKETSFEGIDPTLLCLLAAVKFTRASGDRELKALLQKSFNSFLENLQSNSGHSSDLGDFKRPEKEFSLAEGLIECKANWSWLDSFRHYTLDGGEARLPARIPVEWVSALGVGKARLGAKKFFLLEVNSQWIALLENLLEPKPIVFNERALRELHAEATKNFSKKFFSNGFLAHIACSEFGASGEANSIALEALATLPWMFSREEVRDVVRSCEKLFVRRRGKLFGAMLHESDEKIFFGDDQYHGAVVWPREAPYLIAALERLGETTLVEEILLSNLEHQMQEGAVFFNHELFSLPVGKNPWPSSSSGDPVPVKNPAQLWSQWCQPYFEFLQPTAVQPDLSSTT